MSENSETWLTEFDAAGLALLTPEETERYRRATAPRPVMARLNDDPARFFADAGRTPDPWQAKLLRGDAARTLLLCSRQAGKSTVASALALREALLRPGSLVLLLSPTLRQSGELFRDKVRRLYTDLGRPVAAVQESQLQMELANGSRIVSLPGDEETVRGYSGVSLLVIDEAARVPDDLYKAVRPMLAVSGGRLVCLSTPFGKRGWYYHEWHRGEGWERVKVTAEECPRISADFLAEERRHLGEKWYLQEYGCEFTEGQGEPLFPPDWLDRAAELAERLRGAKRAARGIGIDPGEGMANTSMAAVDELGLIELVSRKTPDTADITTDAIAFIRKHNVPPERVCIDRGGGGKQHADRLRRQGFPVRTLAFGEPPTMAPRRGLVLIEDRIRTREERGAYKDMRAQLYGELRDLLDPAAERGFALPGQYVNLREELSPIPLLRGPEGKLELPPKQRRNPGEGDGKPTLVELIGHSPDEADAVCLAVHAMLHKGSRARAGAR